MKELSLRAYWQHDALPLKEFSDKVEAYLHLLQNLHPQFDNFLVLQTGLDKILIKKDFSNFKELCYKGCFDKEYKYTNLDKNGFVTDESVGKYSIWFSNRNKETDDQFIIQFNIKNFGEVINQSWMQIHFPENDEIFFTTNFCQTIVEKTAHFWKADFANIYTYDFMDKSGGFDIELDTEFGSPGWINYFSNRKILDHINPADFYNVTLSENNGVIITTTQYLHDANNQEQIKQAIHFRDKIILYGFLNWNGTTVKKVVKNMSLTKEQKKFKRFISQAVFVGFILLCSYLFRSILGK